MARTLPPRLPMTDSPSNEGEKPQPQEPMAVQIDPKWCAQLIALLWRPAVTDVLIQPPFRPQRILRPAEDQ